VKQTDKTIISERAKEFIDTVRVGTNCQVGLISSSDVPYVWNSIIPLLEPSQNDQMELSVEDFLECLMSGDMQLWVAMEGEEVIACMISQFAEYPQKKVLRIIFISGEGMDRWIKNFPMVENFALMNGCTFLEVWGRKAWIKILKDWDWECKYHILTKDLKGRMN